MPIRLRCPKCSKSLAVPDAAAGKRAKCPGCGQMIPVPSSVDSSASAAPAPKAPPQPPQATPAAAPAAPPAPTVRARCPKCGAAARGTAAQFTRPVACPKCGAKGTFVPIQAPLGTPAAPQPEPITSEWLLTDENLGLAIRAYPGVWRRLANFSGARGRFLHGPTGGVLVVLWENEEVPEEAEGLKNAVREVAKEVLPRFLGDVTPANFWPRKAGGKDAVTFSVENDTHTLFACMIPIQGHLLKILFGTPRAKADQGRAFFNELLEQTHLREPKDTSAQATRYDMRLGIPAYDRDAVMQADASKQMAVCHAGQYLGLLSLEDIEKRLHAGTLALDSLALTKKWNRDCRWTPLSEVADAMPGLSEAVSPMGHWIGRAGGMAALVGLVLGVPFAIYMACTSLDTHGQWTEVWQVFGLFVGSLIACPLGIIGFRVVSAVPTTCFTKLVGFMVCFAMVVSPLAVLPWTFYALWILLTILIKWLGYFLLYLAPVAVPAALGGVAVGAVIGRTRMDRKVDFATEGGAGSPAASPALWLS